jgi:hypothetical protein
MSALPHDFAVRLQRFDDQRRAIHNRGFALGVVTTLAVLGLVVLWVRVGSAA